MQRKHDEDRSYQDYKTTLWNVFNNKCNERGDEYIAARYFLDHVKARVDMHVKIHALFAVKVDILKLYETKEQLIRKILFDLSKKEDGFGRYLDYIHNPKHLAAMWLFQTAMERLNSWSNGRKEITHTIDTLISERVGQIVHCLVATKEASKALECDKMTMIEWRDLFCEHAKDTIGAIPAHYPIEKAQISFEKSGDKTFVINDINHFESLIADGMHGTMHYSATLPQFPALWERLNAEQARQSLTPNGDSELKDIIDQIAIDYRVRQAARQAVCDTSITINPSTVQASTSTQKRETTSRRWKKCTIL